MPSRSNPNTPSAQRPKKRSTLKSKRLHTQRLVASSQTTHKTADGRIVKKRVPRTSQALRQAAPLSNKKARKLARKVGFEKERERDKLGVKNGEVEMRDAKEEEGNGSKKDKKQRGRGAVAEGGEPEAVEGEVEMRDVD